MRLRVGYLLLGLILGFLGSNFHMQKKLNGIINASLELAGASYQVACMDDKKPYQECHSRAISWVNYIQQTLKLNTNSK